jgi:hypothetical protein
VVQQDRFCSTTGEAEQACARRILETAMPVGHARNRTPSGCWTDCRPLAKDAQRHRCESIGPAKPIASCSATFNYRHARVVSIDEGAHAEQLSIAADVPRRLNQSVPRARVPA